MLFRKERKRGRPIVYVDFKKKKKDVLVAKQSELFFVLHAKEVFNFAFVETGDANAELP